MLEKYKFWKKFTGGVVIGDVPSTLVGEKVILDVNTLTGAESVRIDGTLKGNVDIEDVFTVGQTGSIYGNISAQTVTVAGNVVGNITSKGLIHITSTAKIVGNVQAVDIIIDEGAKLKGTFTIGDVEKDFQFSPVSRFGIQEK